VSEKLIEYGNREPAIICLETESRGDRRDLPY
jgi:hypothetical protein